MKCTSFKCTSVLEKEELQSKRLLTVNCTTCQVLVKI
jgi:hypothetical protein